MLEEKNEWNGKSIRDIDDDIPYPFNIEAEKADMRAIQKPNSSQTLIVSDFTFNFLHSEDDMRQSFDEVVRTLTDDGLFIMNIRHSDETEEGGRVLRGNIKVAYERTETYERVAKEAGLEVFKVHDISHQERMIIYKKAEKQSYISIFQQ